MSVKSSRARKPNGRPRLMLDATERRALRLADDRVRKAKTPEAKKSAQRDADELRKLAALREEDRATAAADKRRADAVAKRRRTPKIKIYRALWKADRSLLRRRQARWTAVTATADYQRVLNGTLLIPRKVLSRGKPSALLPAVPAQDWRSLQRAFDRVRRRELRRLLKAIPPEASETQTKKSTEALETKLDRLWWRGVLRRFRQQPVALREYDARHSQYQSQAASRRAALTEQQIAVLEQRRDEARRKLPKSTNPRDAYKCLRLYDIAAKPLPKSSDRFDELVAERGLTISGPLKHRSDYELMQESFQSSGIQAKRSTIKLKDKKTGQKSELHPETDQRPLDVKAKAAWRDYAKTWNEANERKTELEQDADIVADSAIQTADAA